MRKHNYLKTLKYALIGIGVLGIIVGGYLSRNIIQKQLKGDYYKEKFFSFDENNFPEEDFIILEIVPDYSYARLGYGIKGCEPINYFEACNKNKNAAEWIKKAAGSVDGTEDLVKVRKSLTEKQYNELRSDYLELRKEDIGSYFKKVTKSTVVSGSGISEGEYVLKSENKFVTSNNVYMKMLETDGDDPKVVTVSANDLNKASNPEVLFDKVDLFYINASYCSKVEQEKLSKVSGFYFDEPESTGNTFASSKEMDMEFEAVAKMMKCIGDRENPTPIVIDKHVYDQGLESDVFSKSGINTRQYALNRAVKYNAEDSFKILSAKDDSLFQTKDGDDDLYAAGKNLVGSSNNMYKLYLMTMFRDPSEFYNLFLECGLGDGKPIDIDGIKGKDNLQTGDAVYYWTPYSFLPCKGEISESSKVDPREKGDEKYWKEMGISLSAKNGETVNCNALSVDNTLLTKTSISNINNIIDYTHVSAYTDSRTYTVLELEATNNFTYASDKLCEDGKAEGRAYFEKMFPYTGYTTKDTFWVVVKGMSTATFVSKRNDLTSEYDMIYIGNNIDGFRTTHVNPNDENSKLITCYAEKYKDRNSQMNGVIYSHQGPFVVFRTVSGKERTFKGKIGQSSNYTYFGDGKMDNISCSVGAVNLTKDDFKEGSLRHPGTDITTVRGKHLRSYVTAGLPVVVEDELYEDVKDESHEHDFSDGTITPKERNTTYFEDIKENEMYLFISNMDKNLLSTKFNYHSPKYANDATENEKHVKALKTICVHRPKLTVEKLSTSAGQTFDSEALKKNCVFSSFSSSDSLRQFTFKLNITGTDETKTYGCLIYVDKNADGIYKNNECMRRTSVKLKNSKANVSFNMNSSYTGAFTWKVVVYDTDNPKMISSQIGYGSIPIKEGETKKKIKVLHVKSSNYHSVNWSEERCDTINLGGKNVANPKNSPEFNTSNSDKSDKIISMIKEVSDYNIDVDWMQFLDFNKNISKLKADLLENNKYQMIVFGFADSYSPYKMSEETAKVIQDYIDSGKSVLFSHDLTGPQNHTEWKGDMSGTWEKYHTEPNTGKGFNFYMRDVMGLNRFQMNTKAKDEFCASNYTKHNYHYSKDWLPFGFTYSILIHNSNSYYATHKGEQEKANKDAEDSEFWGPYKGLVTNIWSGKDQDSSHHSATIENGYEAKAVAKVNDGQITKYPYDLDEEINVKAENTILGIDKYKVAKTHTQAYQLNVEDEDTICWFTMQDGSEKREKNIMYWYDASPMDGANNYYIYNRGNVTYTGIGHRGSSELTQFERKLFVNVFVSALRAGIEGPQPEITNGFNVTEKQEDGTETDVQYVYADVDADAEKEEFNEKENIEFYVTDDSTSSNFVYITVEKESKDDEGKTVYEPITEKDGVSITIRPGDSSKNADGSDRVSGPYKLEKDGAEYYVWKIKKTSYLNTISEENSLLTNDKDEEKFILKYPRTDLEKSSTAVFRLAAFGDKGSEGLGIKGVLKAKLCRRSLFRLD